MTGVSDRNTTGSHADPESFRDVSASLNYKRRLGKLSDRLLVVEPVETTPANLHFAQCCKLCFYK